MDLDRMLTIAGVVLTEKKKEKVEDKPKKKNFDKIKDRAEKKTGSKKAGEKVAKKAFFKKIAKEDVDYTDEDIDRIIAEAFDSDDDDDGMTKAEKELAAMGTDDEKLKKKLDKADKQDEDKGAKKAKSEEDEEEIKKPKEEGVTTMTQKYQLSERDRQIAGITDPLEHIDPNSDVIVVLEGEKIACCFSKDQFAQARAYMAKAKSAAGRNGGAGVKATGVKFHNAVVGKTF